MSNANAARPRIVEVRERVLKQNDLLARELRQQFKEAAVRVVSIVSSPGWRRGMPPATTLLSSAQVIDNWGRIGFDEGHSVRRVACRGPSR